jgi:hypothetical protein
MNHYLGIALAVVMVAVSSCGILDVLGLGSDEPPSLAGAPIQTDSAIYHLRTTEHAHELTIGLTYTNPTGSPVYIPTCHTPHPPVLEKWEGGEWVTAYAPVVLLCLGPPVVIGAGEVYAYRYEVSATRRPNTIPRFEVAELPGTYRLVWRMLGTWTPDGSEPGLGKELPLEHRVSNTFRIVK